MRIPLVVVLVGCAGLAWAEPPKDGDPAGELAGATDSRGKVVTLKSLLGRWVVITTTASWCPEKWCIEPLVAWNKLAAEWPTVVFLGLDLTPSEDVASRKKKLAKLELSRVRFAFVDTEKQKGPLFFDGAKIPSITIVDPRGVIRSFKEGYESKQAEAELERLRGELGRLVKPLTPKAEPRSNITPEGLAASLRSYLSAAALTALNQPGESSGCAAAPEAWTHGSSQALEGRTFLETYGRARELGARACDRFRPEGSLSANLTCCVQGFVAGTAAMSGLLKRWSETDFDPLGGGHTGGQADAVDACASDFFRGHEFALRLCGAGSTKGAKPECPPFLPEREIVGGFPGCWSAGFNERLSVCSSGSFYRQLVELRGECGQPDKGSPPAPPK